MLREKYTSLFVTALPASWLLQVAFVFMGPAAQALPVITPVPPPVRATATAPVPKAHERKPAKETKPGSEVKTPTPPPRERKSPALSANSRKKHTTSICSPAPSHKAPRASIRQLAAGLVYKNSRGKQLVNILDVDLRASNLQVVPVLASNTFNRLERVNGQAQKVKALAAINANYFKLDGTPLGALVKDGEWISGPIYHRTALGITDSSLVLVDKANLQGTLNTSRTEIGSLNADSINQPRIHGSRLVVYTPRWGKTVRMPYNGVLAAVDNCGKVVETTSRSITMPEGGFVLSDKKGSSLSKLQLGDTVHLSWQVTPSPWNNVVEAISGGPVLLHEGKIVIDCRGEKFPQSWSGTGIKARTVIGVTGNHHLIMATLEGKHTLYDAARLLQGLGVQEALNLDGGGSTTMIVAGQTVTKNQKGAQRCVAASLAVVEDKTASSRQKTAVAHSPRIAP